jgi:thioredoxin reductase (NADPH)
MLEPLGARRIIRRGELVSKAGQRNLGLTAVLRGELEVFDSRDGQEQILATSGPRGFIGNVAMLMGTASLTNARGKADESEILEVPADRLRQALAELPGVSETIVRAFIMRQQRLKRDREFAGLRILAQNDSQDGPGWPRRRGLCRLRRAQNCGLRELRARGTSRILFADRELFRLSHRH